MDANSIDRSLRLREAPLRGGMRLPVDVDRVRCVVRRERKYLLVQHHARHPQNVGKWNLPGGRLKAREKPKVGLRRELGEELRLHATTLLRLGDWRDRHEIHRIFGCEVFRPLEWFNRNEILAVGWFTLEEVMTLASAAHLRRGFELAAIAEFESRLRA